MEMVRREIEEKGVDAHREEEQGDGRENDPKRGEPKSPQNHDDALTGLRIREKIFHRAVSSSSRSRAGRFGISKRLTSVTDLRNTVEVIGRSQS